MTNAVELRVSEGAEDILVYTFRSAREAGDMIGFLTEFLPEAKFLVQPLRH
ncbi:hypothetical protein HKCCE3408_06140 [Rhodobacterales bacterium HKCCE3408]|nr:hypothetical protein [Rhodobacterales bacterium HKCCE3408]